MSWHFSIFYFCQLLLHFDELGVVMDKNLTAVFEGYAENITFWAGCYNIVTQNSYVSKISILTVSLSH